MDLLILLWVVQKFMVVTDLSSTFFAGPFSIIVIEVVVFGFDFYVPKFSPFLLQELEWIGCHILWECYTFFDVFARCYITLYDSYD